MPQPTPFQRKYDLTNQDGLDLRTQLDVELDDVARCFLETLTNLALIQRDDGELANATVGVEQLKAELIGGFNPPAPFQPYRPYEVNDSFITDDGRWYIVTTEFTSTTDPDDNLADLTLVYDLSTLTSDAEAARDAAEAARDLALQYRDLALQYRDKSQAWAETAEDVEVEVGQFSALHHKAKALVAQTAAETAQSAAEIARTGAEDAEATAVLAADSASQDATSASQDATTATSAASTATTQANRAEEEANRAEGYANGLNLPSATGNGGRYLRQEDDESGFAYVDLDRFATAPYCTDSGAADAYVLTTGFVDAAPVALNDGDQYRFRAGNTNTGASTVNVNSLGAKTLVTVTGVALPAGYIRTDADTTITYDATNDRFVADRKEERGSNANGNYIRTATGYQVCWFGINMGAGNFAGSGSLSDMYRTQLYDWTFPAAFADTIYRLEVTPRATAPGSGGFVTANSGATRGTTGVTGIQCYRGTNSSTAVVAEFVAVGEWYNS